LFFFVVGRRQARTILAALICLTIVLAYQSLAVWANARGGSNPDLVWYVSTDEPAIALTFDDGPDPKYTPAVLKALDQYGAKATFFFIGRNVEEYPDLVRQVVAAGHEVGNHTYSHQYNLSHLPEGEIVRQIEKTAALVGDVSGYQTKVFRPPGGAYNPHLISVVKSLGYDIILWTWTTNPSDAYAPGSDKITRRATEAALPGDIILLHEGVNHGQTLKALPQIMKVLSDRGFKFVTVSQLLALRKAPLPTH
jgi:peptidoglycan/xylan/chitin deacetylase (PgdA/CDA1 family)